MPAKKRAEGAAIVRKKSAKKKRVQKKPAQKKPAVQKKAVRRKPIRAVVAPKRRSRKSPILGGLAFSREESRSRLGGSGDLQGLSDVEGADSESVDELLEEGNAFEADVVAGVEEAANADEKEVRTHEVPEDDVPDEYLEKD